MAQMTFDTVSEKNLTGLSPNFVSLIRKAGVNLQEVGISIRIYSGLRTSAQQMADFAKGRTAPGPIVTNAEAGQSSHNYGLAIDAVPFDQGDAGTLDWSTSDPEYKHFVQIMLNCGLKWGGDWASFKDMDHFYIGPDSPTEAMQEAYASGKPLPTIWALVEETE